MFERLWELRIALRLGAAVALTVAPVAAGLLPNAGLTTAHLQLILLATVLASALLAGLGTSFAAATLGFGLLLWRAVERPVGGGSGQGWTLDTEAAVNAFLWFAVAKLTAALVAALRSRIAQLSEAGSRARAEAHQRDLLLAELSHRVMNDMQMLTGMLHAQAAQSAEPETANALRAAAGRARVLRRVHERLSAQRRTAPTTAEAAVADSRPFIEGLVSDLRAGVDGARPVTLVAAAESHLLPLAAMGDVGLVANELVTNALKHAFPGGREGVVRVHFRREGDVCELSVADNGVGVATATKARQAAPQPERASSSGQGGRLLRALAAQLGGRLEVVAGEVGGTLCRLRFPMPSSATSGAASVRKEWPAPEAGLAVVDVADAGQYPLRRPRFAAGPGA